MNMKRFVGTAESDAFKQWMQFHPSRLYLNDRTGGLPMLHEVGCIRLDDGEGYSATSNSKTGFESLSELDEWKKQNLPLQSCSTCLKGNRGR